MVNQIYNGSYKPPNHMLPDSEKARSEWYIPTFNYYAARCVNSTSNIRSIMERSDQLYNNIITEQLIRETLSIINNTSTVTNIRERFRISNLISTTVEKLLGDYDRIPYNVAIKSNSGIVNKDKLFMRMYNYFNTYINNIFSKQMEELMAGGSPSEVEFVPTQLDIKNATKQAIAEISYEEEHILAAYLNSVKSDIDFSNLKRQLFVDWIVFHQWYVLLDNNKEQLVAERLNPLQSYPLLSNKEDVSDMQAFLYIDYYDYEDAINKFKNYSKQAVKILNFIEENKTNTTNMYLWNPRVTHSNAEQDILFNKPEYVGKNIRVSHLLYKSKEVIRYIRQHNQFGIETLIEWSPTVEGEIIDLPKDSVLEQYLIESNGRKFYTEPVLILSAPTAKNDELGVRLPVTGRFSNIQNKYNTIVYKLMPYAVEYELYNILIKQAFMKFKGSLKILPKQLYADDKDLTMEKKIVLAELNNLMLYDSDIVDVSIIQQGIRVIGDNDIVNHISSLVQRREQIKMDGLETLHLTGSRVTGQSPYQSAAAAKLESEQAIAGSHKLFKDFDESLVNMLELGVEMSKYIYYGRRHLELEESDAGAMDNLLTLRDYGLVLTDAITEMNKLQHLKDYAFGMAQNGNARLGFSAIINEDTQSIRRDIESTIEQQEQQAQQSQAITQQLERDKLEWDKQKFQMEMEVKLEIARLQYDSELKRAELDGQTRATIQEQKTMSDKEISRNKQANQPQPINPNVLGQVGKSYADDKPAVENRQQLELLKTMLNNKK